MGNRISSVSAQAFSERLRLCLGGAFALGREAAFLDQSQAEPGEGLNQYIDLVEGVGELFRADLEA